MNASSQSPALPLTEWGCVRDYRGNRLVYLILTSRTHGLSIGVNFSPDCHCSFDCVHCEVDRSQQPISVEAFDPDQLSRELAETIDFVTGPAIRADRKYAGLTDEMLILKQVTISGDGEPTLAGHFFDGVERIAHVRARNAANYFKLVLLTNGTGLAQSTVQSAMRFFTNTDEIWARLDAGSRSRMVEVNRPTQPVSLDRILKNYLELGRARPIVIHSTFPMIRGNEPSQEDVSDVAQRIVELKRDGAAVVRVQIASASVANRRTGAAHIPLRNLSAIARRIGEITGIPTEMV